MKNDKNIRWVLLGLSLFLFGGCATKVPLTQGLLYEYSVAPHEFRQLQYYVSNRIDLRSENRVEKRGRDGDGLSGRSHVVREHVYVLPDTPGIAESGDYDQILVSFEEGSRFLFQWYASQGRADGRYLLTPQRKLTPEERMNQSYPMGLYAFQYRGKEYYSQQTQNVYLLVKVKDLRKVVETRHKLPGRTVSYY